MGGGLVPNLEAGARARPQPTRSVVAAHGRIARAVAPGQGDRVPPAVAEPEAERGSHSGDGCASPRTQEARQRGGVRAHAKREANKSKTDKTRDTRAAAPAAPARPRHCGREKASADTEPKLKGCSLLLLRHPHARKAERRAPRRRE